MRYAMMRSPSSARSMATRTRNSRRGCGYTTRYAASVAAAGHSAVLDCAAGVNTAEQAVALASRCVMSGRSVLYVPCVSDQKRRFMQAMRANELGGLVLDLADPDTNGAIDKQLITAVGFQSGVATSRFDQLSDELVGGAFAPDPVPGRSAWGEPGLGRLRVSDDPASGEYRGTADPSGHPVRLSKESARALKGRLDEWSDRLRRAGELGEFVIGPADTAWYKASLFTEEEAVAAYQRVSDVLLKMLPATREQVTSVVQNCGFPVRTPPTIWARQVTVLKNLRRVLDVFQPEIFERDINAMIEASKSKAARKARAPRWASGSGTACSRRPRACCAWARRWRICTMPCRWWPVSRAVARVRASRRLAGVAAAFGRHHRHPGAACGRSDGAGHGPGHHAVRRRSAVVGSQPGRDPSQGVV